MVESDERSRKLLDCFCGIGGVSDGFALEGFEVTGIDIVDAQKMLGYKHRFIQADMLMLDGKDFRGFDVVWGSPPCRDFSQIGKLYGKRWKNPPNPQKGLELVNCFLKFVEEAKPKIWIMENVALLKNHLKIKPRAVSFITYGKKHVFYGNFPLFLMPRDMRIKVRATNKYGRDQPNYNFMEPLLKTHKLRGWVHAKIPLSCSCAFARACKEKLEID